MGKIIPELDTNARGILGCNSKRENLTQKNNWKRRKLS